MLFKMFDLYFEAIKTDKGFYSLMSAVVAAVTVIGFFGG